MWNLIQDIQTCVTAIRKIEYNVVRGFDGVTNNFRFETLLKMYRCLKGKPYEYQQFVGSIAKKQAAVAEAEEGMFALDLSLF